MAEELVVAGSPFGLGAKLYTSDPVSEALQEITRASHPQTVDWMIARTPIEVAYLAQLVQVSEHRPVLRGWFHGLLDAEVRLLADLRTAAGYPAPARWDADGHAVLDGVVAQTIDWALWLGRRDNPEQIAGYREYVTLLPLVRGATWIATGEIAAKDDVDLKVASILAGKSERSIQRMIVDGLPVRRYGDGMTLVDPVAMLDKALPAIREKPQVKWVLSPRLVD